MIRITLKEMADARGKSLMAISMAAEVPYPTVWNIVNKPKNQRIDLQVLSRLCAALKCEPGDLLKFIPDDQDKAIMAMAEAKESVISGARKPGRPKKATKK